MKSCGRCGLNKDPETCFHKNASTGDGYAKYCKLCTANYTEAWQKANPDKYEARKASGRKQRAEARAEVLKYYGAVCRCCNESNPLFLTVEHILGGGRQHRRKIGASAISIWLVKNGFPEGFELLCYNCNCGKRVNNGVCPHEGAAAK